MRAVFYINTFLRKKHQAHQGCMSQIYFQISMFGTCKINHYTIFEARKPLKFFNSLFLLRTSANTILCSVVVHIQDALKWRRN